MELDDELCLCFHVSKRKVLNFLRIHTPRRPSELSECFGAGTGCGWCRVFLERLWQAQQAASTPTDEPSAQEYAQQRRAYVRAGNGTPPPGATPIEEGPSS